MYKMLPVFIYGVDTNKLHTKKQETEMKTIAELTEELEREKQKVELLKEMLRQSEQNKEAPTSFLFKRMTLKQHAALQMLFRAASNEEIAERLDVSLPTAKGLIRTIALNAGLKNRAALVARYKPLFDSLTDHEYKLITGGLKKEWDNNFKEEDPINELLRRKKHASDREP